MAQNAKFNQLVEPGFVLVLENDAQRKSDKRYYLRNKEINESQCYDWRKKHFWSASKKYQSNIGKHWKKCHWSRRCLYNWLFRLYLLRDIYKMIAMDLSKEQALHAYPKAIQQID